MKELGRSMWSCRRPVVIESGGGWSRLILFISIFVGASAAAAIAESPKWFEAGVLDCTVGPSIGLVMGARQHARCFYKAADAAGTISYIGRLERIGKMEGLPSGGKLVWIVVATDSLKKELSGRYLVPLEHFGHSDPRTLCRLENEAICLRPTAQDGKRKPNLAFAIAAFRLEASPARSRRRPAESP